jgi:hypothetical protein
MATLWRIDGEGAAVFAERFNGWLRHAGPTEALARANATCSARLTGVIRTIGLRTSFPAVRRKALINGP